jgi:phosphate transport system substrate-binding protein
VLALGVAACGDDGGGGGTVSVDGSSTVGPLTEAVAEDFQAENDVNVTVGISGTGGGFEKFCAGETDISDASRPIESEEVDACKKNGVKYTEILVALDGLAVVVNPNNDFASCLTVDQLKKIWNEGSKVNNWNQVDDSYPDQQLELFGPGTDSGTFDFFTEQINGEEGVSRSDYSASEDDNVTLQGVSGSEGGVGYFGLSYSEQNEGTVKPIEIDGGNGCVAPSAKTVQDGTYEPLSRPLFIYTSNEAVGKQEVADFVRFYQQNLDAAVEKALFISLTPEQKNESDSSFEKALSSAGGGGTQTQ